MNKPTIPPSTRYLGSKLGISKWIIDSLKDVPCQTVLECFGGTGTIGYLLKRQGKKVTYNDNLKFNQIVGKSIIENNKFKLSQKDIDFVLTRHNDVRYHNFIQKTFKGMYYTDKENRWLDMAIKNIQHLHHSKKALAFNALFQSCMRKRPYNLFHRKNLYMRLADIARSCGNKTTWDRSFESHFQEFADELNSKIFDNKKKNTALNLDVLELPEKFDLVYIDSPYMSQTRPTNYRTCYHFLEGIVNYNKWGGMIDYSTNLKRLHTDDNPWTKKSQIYSMFEKIFKKFQKSAFAVSYKKDGIPNEKEMKKMLMKYKKNVVIKRKSHQYVLSDRTNEELLFIAQ